MTRPLDVRPTPEEVEAEMEGARKATTHSDQCDYEVLDFNKHPDEGGVLYKCDCIKTVALHVAQRVAQVRQECARLVCWRCDKGYATIRGADGDLVHFDEEDRDLDGIEEQPCLASPILKGPTHDLAR